MAKELMDELTNKLTEDEIERIRSELKRLSSIKSQNKSGIVKGMKQSFGFNAGDKRHKKEQKTESIF